MSDPDEAESVSSDAESEPELEDDDVLKGFASAYATILGREVKGNPVFALKQSAFNKLAQEKEEAKLSRIAAAERKKLGAHAHVLPDVVNPLEKGSERELHRLATRGVVQLLNAVQEFRSSQAVEIPEDETKLGEKRSTKDLKRKREQTLATEKDKFMKLLKSSKVDPLDEFG